MDGGWRPACDGSTANEALRVGGVGGVEGGPADLEDGVDAVVVDVGGGEEGDAGVAMVVFHCLLKSSSYPSKPLC